MPGTGAGPLARRSAGRAAASAVLSCRLTLPAPVGEIAFQNKSIVYAILFRTAAEILATIAADPQHLSAQLGMTMVLHTWGQTLQHHPHVHCVVTGGGPSLDGTRWVACRPGFFLPVRVQDLQNALDTGNLRFFGKPSRLSDPEVFARHLDGFRRINWVVYAKSPFGGPEQVLAYLGRYTRRVAIANSRLISLSDGKVRFTWKDYRATGKTKVMMLAADEFIRRFLLHTLPDGFHRIRHYGFLANGSRSDNLARCRRLLDARDTDDACEPITERAKADGRSPPPTSPSVPIAAAPCGGSPPCHALPTFGPSTVIRHDIPAAAHHCRPQTCWRRALQLRHVSCGHDQSCRADELSVPVSQTKAIIARNA